MTHEYLNIHWNLAFFLIINGHYESSCMYYFIFQNAYRKENWKFFWLWEKISEEKNFLSFLFMIAFVIIEFSVNEIMHLFFKIVEKYIEMIIYLCLKS